MTAEPRIDEPRINIVKRSGATTRNDQANGNKEVEATWIMETTEKAPTFDALNEKKAFIEVRKRFMDDGDSNSIA